MRTWASSARFCECRQGQLAAVRRCLVAFFPCEPVIDSLNAALMHRDCGIALYADFIPLRSDRRPCELQCASSPLQNPAIHRLSSSLSPSLLLVRPPSLTNSQTPALPLLPSLPPSLPPLVSLGSTLLTFPFSFTPPYSPLRSGKKSPPTTSPPP